MKFGAMSFHGVFDGSEALAARGVTRGFTGKDAHGFAAENARGSGTSDAAASFVLAPLFGRLTELSGGPASASLTLAFRLVHRAQKEAEPVAWILGRGSVFFPPDAAAAGIDLEALVVIRLPEPAASPRAADFLIRSGAFGLVVLDLGGRVHVPMAVQTRLVGLARKHGTAILCLTEKKGDEPSLGSLVSYRVEAVREPPRERRYGLRLNVLKDKVHAGMEIRFGADPGIGADPGNCGAGRCCEELFRGVDGLY
jgi:recombination protein RecA